MQQVMFKDLGLIDYKTAWDYQEKLLNYNVKLKSSNLSQVNKQNTCNSFLLCEHTPVYTLGKNGSLDNIFLTEQQLTERSISFFHTNRGGDITFHGLQQLVGYPVLDLEKFGTDLGKYLRNLEEMIILTLAEYGITGDRIKGETGVWIDADIPGAQRKICAIGIRCSRWITMHGFALNVNTDLSYFDHILPCGLKNRKVTSLKNELHREVNFEDVKQRIRKSFEKIFNARLSS